MSVSPLTCTFPCQPVYTMDVIRNLDAILKDGLQFIPLKADHLQSAKEVIRPQSKCFLLWWGQMGSGCWLCGTSNGLVELREIFQILLNKILFLQGYTSAFLSYSKHSFVSCNDQFMVHDGVHHVPCGDCTKHTSQPRAVPASVTAWTAKHPTIHLSPAGYFITFPAHAGRRHPH